MKSNRYEGNYFRAPSLIKRADVFVQLINRNSSHINECCIPVFLGEAGGSRNFGS